MRYGKLLLAVCLLMVLLEGSTAAVPLVPSNQRVAPLDTIQGPLGWKQWAVFLPLLGLLELGSILVLMKHRMNALERQKQRAELRAHCLSIPPHFLFHALSSIQSALVEKPDRAQRYVPQLAHLLRRVIAWSELKWIRLEDELQFALDFMELEAQPRKIQYSIRMTGAKETTGIWIPPLMSLCLMENSIRHAFVNGMRTAKIKVRYKVDLQRQLTTILVHDNGSGWGSLGREGLGTGLRTLHARLLLSSTGKVQGAPFQLCHSGPGGSEVAITVPIVVCTHEKQDPDSRRPPQGGAFDPILSGGQAPDRGRWRGQYC